jgi:hypothetical protein
MGDYCAVIHKAHLITSLGKAIYNERRGMDDF